MMFVVGGLSIALLVVVGLFYKYAQWALGEIQFYMALASTHSDRCQELQHIRANVVGSPDGVVYVSGVAPEVVTYALEEYFDNRGAQATVNEGYDAWTDPKMWS